MSISAYSNIQRFTLPIKKSKLTLINALSKWVSSSKYSTQKRQTWAVSKTSIKKKIEEIEEK